MTEKEKEEENTTKMPPKGNPESVALDFTSVKPFDPIDDKILYKAQVGKFALGRSKQGKPKVSLEATIIAPEEVLAMEAIQKDVDGIPTTVLTGEYATDKDGNPMKTKAQNRKLFREYSLESNALPFLHEFLKAVDPEIDLTPKDKKGQPLPFDLKTKEYIGRAFVVRIKNEVFEEQVRPRVIKVLPETAYQG